MSVDADNSTATTTVLGAQARLYREVSLLAGDSSSRNEYFSRVLKHVARAFSSPYASIYVRSNTEVFEDYWHQGGTDPKFWQPVVQDALTAVLSSGEPSARLLSARQSPLTLGLITVPVVGPSGGSDGALAIIAKLNEEEARESLVVLESLVALMMHAAQSLGRPAEAGPSKLAEAHSGVTKAAGCESSDELAFSLAASLRTNIGCQQVALGLVEGRRVRLLAISGQDEVRTQTPGAQAISQAMEECLDQGEIVVAQAESRAADAPPAQAHRLHSQWHYQARNAAVASIPLKSDDRTVVVVSLQLRQGAKVTTQLLAQVAEAMQPFVPVLLLLERANRGLLRHGSDSTRNGLRWLLAPGRHLRRAVAIAAVASLAWLLFGSMTYRVNVTAIVRPVQLRHIGMPYDAALAGVEKQPGDRVAAGEILCRLDARELQLQRDELAAESAVAEQELQRAMAVGTPVDARLAEMEVKLIRVRLATLDSRIERAAIRSPIDGLVVEGDLRTRIGSVMSQGTALAQVAPDHEWRLDLRVPDHAGLHIRQGLAGRFVSFARPETAQTFRINLLQPSAVPHERQMVFLAEARLDDFPPWLRPGMEGMAKIEVGPRAAWWVLFHSAIDYLRVSFWI